MSREVLRPDVGGRTDVPGQDGGDGTLRLLDRRAAAPAPDRGRGRGQSGDRGQDEGYEGHEDPGGRGPTRGTRIAAAVVAVLLLGAGAGWVSRGAWAATQDQPGAAGPPPAAAVVIDVRPSSATAGRTGADLLVRISDLGRSGLTLIGAEAAFDAGEITSVTPKGLQVPAGGGGLALLHAAIACGSPQPLNLPALQLRSPDGMVESVTADGSAAALARVCQLQAPPARLLELDSVSLDGASLRLQVSSPTGRTTQITGVSAGGVDLAGRPVPSTVDGSVHTLWLDPPPQCPAEWQLSGLPRTVQLRLDSGGDSTVSLDLGFTLARWLLAGVCSGAR